MDCPKCQGFLLLEPGPLAFDDYRCLNCGWRPALVRIAAPSPVPPERAPLEAARAANDARAMAGLCLWCENLRLAHRKVCKRHLDLLCAAQQRRRRKDMAPA